MEVLSSFEAMEEKEEEREMAVSPASFVATLLVESIVSRSLASFASLANANADKMLTAFASSSCCFWQVSFLPLFCRKIQRHFMGNGSSIQILLQMLPAHQPA